MSDPSQHTTFWDGAVAAVGVMTGFLGKVLHGRAAGASGGDEYARKEDLVQLKKDLKEHEDREAGYHISVLDAIADLRQHIDTRIDASNTATAVRIDNLMMRDPGK